MSRLDEWEKAVIEAVVDVTNLSAFLTGKDLPFMRSVPEINEELAAVSDQILLVSNSQLQKYSECDFKLHDYIHNFSPIQEIIDSVLENVDGLLDGYTRLKNAPSIIKGTPSQIQSHSTNAKRPDINLRPQLKFKDTVDNSNTPFCPIIKYKPNAQRPLEKIENSCDETPEPHLRQVTV